MKSGWGVNSDEIAWREGQGLFIKPRWTDRAAALVAAKEYRFLSAVFPYDAQGRPLELQTNSTMRPLHRSDHAQRRQR